MLTRQAGEWAPGLQEDGAQAQPHSPGPRMDPEDAGPHLGKGKDMISGRRHTGPEVPAGRLLEVRTPCADQVMGVSTKMDLCIKQHAENSNQVSQRSYVQCIEATRPIMHMQWIPWEG